MRLTVLSVLLGLTLVAAAHAADPAERLTDPALEARAEALSSELRCLVCQNQSIESSDADLARDLRRLVRERIAAGDSDAAVKDFLVARYGDFVLLKPRFAGVGLVLWLLPVLLLLAGAAAARSAWRRRRESVEAEPLTAEEEARVARLIGEADDPADGQPGR